MEKRSSAPKIPIFESIDEMAEFWDTHDSTDYEDQLIEVTGPIFVRRRTPPLSFAEKTKMPKEIAPKNVRYIKLGRHGSWEKECLETGIIRLGFGTEQPHRFRFGQSGDWDKLKKSFLDEKNALKEAARFTREVRLFFEDDGSTLWITFHGEQLFWAFLDPKNPPKKHRDGVGVWRNVAGSWKTDDLNGKPLRKNTLSASLTKLAGYPGTSCDVRAADYVTRRINGYARRQAVQGLSHSSEPTMFPNEVDDRGTYVEGAVCRVMVNAYERNPKARRRCIDFHGTKCYICGFDFFKAYGPIAEGFIHVHHLRELSEIQSEYKVDPIKDLRPVCPNCHAVLHRRKPSYSIEEVKKFLR